MSALRAPHDHAVVLRSQLARARQSLLASWRDGTSAQFDQNVLRPLGQEADRLVRAIAEADARIETALVALRRASDM